MGPKRKRTKTVEVCDETPRKKAKLYAKCLFSDETNISEVKNIDGDYAEQIRFV
nr:unnamed protein product [Callosobruchus analis]